MQSFFSCSTQRFTTAGVLSRLLIDLLLSLQIPERQLLCHLKNVFMMKNIINIHGRKIEEQIENQNDPLSKYHQFSSVAQSCPTLCDPMNLSTPGFPVHHQLPEFTQTHVHRVGDTIQPSHPLLSPSPPAPNPSQHQGLFQ